MRDKLISQLTKTLGSNPGKRVGRLTARSDRSLFVWFLLTAMICLPFAVQGFLLFQITLLLVYALAILGLNLLMGFNGQVSLGHGAFYALGAYTTAILMKNA